MEYNIKGFEGYKVTDDRQIIKVTQTAKGEKVSIISAYRQREDSELEYVKLTRKQDGGSQRFTLSLDEVFVSAKLGVEPGTPEAKAALRQFRHQQGLMGRVSAAVGDAVKEQELVNIIHADLMRQMGTIGIHVDVDQMTTFSVAQLMLDYLKICKECSVNADDDHDGRMVRFTQEVTTKHGVEIKENPLWNLKLKIFDRLITGLRALGLTYERTVKQLPQDVMEGVSSNMFEQKEHEESLSAIGITWNQ